VPEQAEKKGYRQLFVERMKREGRGKEWFRLLKEEMAATGKQHGAIVTVVMRKMGYVSADDEREREARYLDGLKTSAVLDEVKGLIGAMKEDVVLEFEAAVATLPDTATAQAEIDWIRAHPAMARMNRTQDRISNVLITAEDILSPPHGPAPSKGAVYALQHWANHPTEFFKNLLSEQKKATDSGGPNGTIGGDDLSEVERLLIEVGGASATATQA